MGLSSINQHKYNDITNKIKNGTVKPNDNRYKGDIVIPNIKNVGANKISVSGKDIVVTKIVISRFCCTVTQLQNPSLRILLH